MLLNSATQKLVCVLTSAKTTNDMPITLNYASTVTAPFSFVGIPVNMFTNGLTPVDPLLLGVVGAQLTVKKLTVYNNDTAAKGYRIGIVDFTTPIVAGSFVAGRPYQITAAGSTDFTLVGAANSTVGTIFNATGVGAGTGTASPFYQENDVTLQIDDVLGYTDTGGWYVNDASGAKKTIAAIQTNPTFSAYASAVTSLVQNVATKVGFQTKEWDTTNAYDAVTNFRYIPLVAGYYQVTTALQVGVSANIYLQIYKNGSAYKSSSSVTGAYANSFSALVFLNGNTDYIEIFCNQTAATQNSTTGIASTYFQATLTTR